MLYSLDTVEPDDMGKHLRPGVAVVKKIFEGTYALVGKNVYVEVKDCLFFFLCIFLSVFFFMHSFFF
jgi:hypothetical protein